ncbi:hypothetical protein AB0N17_25710, partial [Streptomyces sp. NPDC051133]|uniref:hypothetical protein n=1 Tax=Streptomyces sp. NPDC051133 TaxID=3155521 RepID=UPI00341DEA00
MTRTGGARRRWWRWAVPAWAVAVAVGGGATFWLQQEARPGGPYVWQDGGGSAPPADGKPLSDDGADEERHGCPPEFAAASAPGSATGSAAEPYGTPLVCVT